jgi:hypothetical protein
MRRRFQILMLSLAGASVMSSAIIANSFPQSSARSEAQQNGVLIAKLSMPVYPPWARATGITGDVNLLLGIRRDGSIETATIVNGQLLLQQAALASAQNSQFECRGCTEAVTSYSLVYTFQLAEGDCAAATINPSNGSSQSGEPRAQVIQSQSNVTVMDKRLVTCDPAASVTKVRSVKCLYLWRCGTR